ncbi:MAG TPA: hypothetical protein VNB06_21265 [Thermoanaerobaculia bacterium]|nr:hypothetical protein [Thermoanaerobaculia bacterium]
MESHLPEAPAALGRFFVRALDPEPERRPPTAAEFYSELLEAIGSWSPSG